MSCFIHIAVLIGAAVAALLSLETFLGTSNWWHVLLAAPVVCVVFQTIYAKYLPHSKFFSLFFKSKFFSARLLFGKRQVVGRRRIGQVILNDRFVATLIF